RTGLFEGCHAIGQPLRGEAGHAPYEDLPLVVAVPQFGGCKRKLGERGRDAAMIARACLGKVDLPSRPVKERDTQPVLELTQVTADDRMIEIEARGGAPDAAQASHRLERPE